MRNKLILFGSFVVVGYALRVWQRSRCKQAFSLWKQQWQRRVTLAQHHRRIELLAQRVWLRRALLHWKHCIRCTPDSHTWAWPGWVGGIFEEKKKSSRLMVIGNWKKSCFASHTAIQMPSIKRTQKNSRTRAASNWAQPALLDLPLVAYLALILDFSQRHCASSIH